VRNAFKYRLYPTAQQDQALAAMLETHRRRYNRALAERKTAWDERQDAVSSGQPSAHLQDERTTNPDLAHTTSGAHELLQAPSHLAPSGSSFPGILPQTEGRRSAGLSTLQGSASL
jgi:putative transposase